MYYNIWALVNPSNNAKNAYADKSAFTQGLKQNTVAIEPRKVRLHNLYHYIRDVIRNKMVPRDLPFNKSMRPKLTKKQRVHNNNTHAIAYLQKMNHNSVPVHCIKLK